MSFDLLLANPTTEKIPVLEELIVIILDNLRAHI